jgi:hypothetical protein
VKHPLPSTAACATLLTFLLPLAGCGSSSKTEPVFPVTGSVRVSGQPAAQAMVVFHRDSASEGAPRSFAKTDAEGKFALTTFAAQDGAPAGSYRITVTWPPTEDEEKPGLKDKLQGRYSNPQTSSLNYTVKPEANQVPPLDLR